MENIIDFKIKKSRCSYFLKKNGKVIYYPFEVYDDFLCVLVTTRNPIFKARSAVI